MQPTDPRASPPAGERPDTAHSARAPRSARRLLHPAGWPRPKGYAYGVVAEGRLVCLSGIIGWDAQGRLVGDDLVSQTRQALTTIAALIREAGGTPGDIARMTWYVVDKQEYLAAQEPLGAVYREVIGRHFPAMTIVQVAGLLEDRARVEIEVTAILEEAN
jgi:enamine deaminase RidA (YjgF/YER057c/UK114 family)